MRKNYFLGIAAAFGLLAFSSCSNEDDPVFNNQEQEAAAGEQVIVLDMQDTDVLSTKSRPLYSTENKGAEQVTDVQLLVFGIKSDGVQYEFVKKLPAITNWNTSPDVKDYDYGRKYEMKLTGSAKLDKNHSKYIILAVGQDEANVVDAIPAPFKIELGSDDKYVKELADNTWTVGAPWNVASTPGAGFWQTAALDYTQETTKHVGEIFSGVSSPIEFTADGGFSTTVLLKRQVAGVLGYFSRIPATVGDGAEKKMVTNIRLVSSNRNNALDLSTALVDQVDDAIYGKPGYKKTEAVVNGFNDGTKTADAKFGIGKVEDTNKDAYIVYDIDLTKWFDLNETGDGWSDDALLEEEGEGGVKLLGNVKGWQNALDASNSTNVVVADGSVMAGEFVIPFEKTMEHTFELQLVNKAADETTVLKVWDVKLDPMSQGEKDSDKIYNIYRNHLYQVGKRGGGDDPTDPGKDPDKPQPLDKDQELIIKINDNWEFIHDMEIE